MPYVAPFRLSWSSASDTAQVSSLRSRSRRSLVFESIGLVLVGLAGEQERLHGNRNRFGNAQRLADVQEVEVAHVDAIDRDHVALDSELFAQNAAQRLRNVQIQHDVNGVFGIA